jgi:hypothetical protein
MSISFRPYLLSMTVAAAQCTVVITSGDLNSFSVFDLSPGIRVLTISGADGSGDPAHARPCVFAGAFAGGRLVQTQIDLEPQGSDWIGRSTAASAGTIVVTLRTVGSPGGRHTVSGTISGQATSVTGTPASGPSGVRVVFDPVATQTIDGSGATIGQFVAGNITGAATFTDANGVSSRCDWVQWSLQPTPPG